MRVGVALLAALAALVAAPSAYACACCAENNEWRQYRGTVDLNELGRVKFKGRAQLFSGIDRSDGIRDPKSSYPLTVGRSGRVWKLSFGSAGTLSMAMPAQGEFYAVDLHDGKRSGGGGPLLYKELRLSGKAAGTGTFAGGSFRLVLIGRGNRCLAAEDFTRWHLEISGPNADYALHGSLA